MKTIWKYDLPLAAYRITHKMPKGAQILNIQTQHGKVALWVSVDDARPLEDRTFVVVGTGQSVPEGDLKHLGTTQHEYGFLVLHWFEVLE